MGFDQTAKTLIAAVVLAVVMFAVFVAGQMNPMLRGHGQPAQSAPTNVYFPRGSEDGRFGSKCAASTLFGRTVCGVPFARLIAFPERYQQSVIAVTGFLVATGQGRQSLYPNEDSYRNMGEYERLEIGTGVPDAIRAKMGQGVWVRVIGEFDGTYAGQPWGLGAISQVMDIAEARPDVSPVIVAVPPPRTASRLPQSFQVPVPAASLIPAPAREAARNSESSGEQSSSPVTYQSPKVALRTGEASVLAASSNPENTASH
jgi:hypothetical protein